jgi:hypothetical protein
MSSVYAVDTEVPAEKSRMEIEKTLARYGATGFFYATDDEGKTSKAIIGFRMNGKLVQLQLPLPRITDDEVRLAPNSSWREAPKAAQQKKLERLTRQRWRCLGLAVKAKLEIVASGIATFEAEFLAHILTADGRTVGSKIMPLLDAEYKTGKPAALLLGAPS